jgi:hypothetical protein
LNIPEIFQNLTHLLVSYIRKEDFSFTGLDHTKKINTLCLLSENKISDFNFLSNAQKSNLKNLSLEYTANFNSLNGIDKFENLEKLFLFESTSERRKTVALRNLSGIEKLRNLNSFEIDYFKFDLEELKRKSDLKA